MSEDYSTGRSGEDYSGSSRSPAPSRPAPSRSWSGEDAGFGSGGEDMRAPARAPSPSPAPAVELSPKPFFPSQEELDDLKRKVEAQERAALVLEGQSKLAAARLKEQAELLARLKAAEERLDKAKSNINDAAKAAEPAPGKVDREPSSPAMGKRPKS